MNSKNVAKLNGQFLFAYLFSTKQKTSKFF